MNSAARKSKKCRKASKKSRMVKLLENILIAILDMKRESAESQPPPPPPPQPEISKPSAIQSYSEWPPKEVVADPPVLVNWYRQMWAEIAFYLLLANIPAAISATFGLISQEWPMRIVVFAILHALRCGINAPGIFAFIASLFNTVISVSCRKGRIRIPDPNILFRGRSLTPSQKRSLWGYISLLIYYSFPKKFYEKIFKLNYGQLLDNLNRPDENRPQYQYLTNEDISILVNSDSESHKGKVLNWIYKIIGENGQLENKFLKFEEELKQFNLKYFEPNEMNELILMPIAKFVILLANICSLSDFAESGFTYETMREFPIWNVLGLFFLYISFYCGIYTIDVYDPDDFFFNGMKEHNFNIKKHYKSVENDIEQYCNDDK